MITASVFMCSCDLWMCNLLYICDVVNWTSLCVTLLYCFYFLFSILIRSILHSSCPSGASDVVAQHCFWLIWASLCLNYIRCETKSLYSEMLDLLMFLLANRIQQGLFKVCDSSVGTSSLPGPNERWMWIPQLSFFFLSWCLSPELIQMQTYKHGARSCSPESQVCSPAAWKRSSTKPCSSCCSWLTQLLQGLVGVKWNRKARAFRGC